MSEEARRTVLTLECPPEAEAKLREGILSRDPVLAAKLMEFKVVEIMEFKLDANGFMIEGAG